MAPPAKTAPRKRVAAAKVVEAPPEEVVPEPAPQGGGQRRLVLPIIGVVLLLLAGVLMMALGAQERGGPPHTWVFMGDGVPGTLYMPGDAPDDMRFPEPKPKGQRPPVIVMGHGYSSDQQGMSILARSLAKAGYATLTFDFQGHGANPHRFVGDLRNDLKTVLDWVEQSPHVDTSRIVVLGHSMGASAGLDFATIDPRVNTVIPVSGGDVVNEAHVPAHALFLVASGDPGPLKDDSEESAARLASFPGADVKSVTIKGTDHVTIIRDGQTVKAISDYLDASFGGAPADRESTDRNDPRWGTAVLYLLVCLGLVALLGRVVGSVVPAVPTTATGQAWILLVGALILTLPLMSLGGPTFLPVHAGQGVALSLAFAAAALFAVRHFVQRGVIGAPVSTWIGDGPWLPARASLVPGAIAGFLLFLLLAPAGIVIHRSVPDWERIIYWVILAALMLPFFAAFEAIVRRGGTWAAIGFGLLGRLLLLAVLFVGIAVGALSGVLALVLPLLVLQYVLLEIFAATCYARGRNTAVIAVVDTVFIAWIGVMFSPLS